MRIGILQPGYLPWLGFFEQVYRSDVFVLYDDVQYDKNGWRNRNRIKTPAGNQWLTVPVCYRFSERPQVKDVRVNNATPWSRKHWRALEMNYAKAPFLDAYRPFFEETYTHDWELLIDLDLHLIFGLTEALGMDTGKFVRSSSLAIAGDRLERLVRICDHFGADVFYEGAAGSSYIDESVFKSHGIRVEYQHYEHPTYRQLHGEFVPYLSVVDLLLNHGSESLRILTSPGTA